MPRNEASNEDVAKRVAGGDREAFRLLLVRFQAPLVAMATGWLGDANDAEDAVVASFERLWSSRSKLSRIDDLKAWLYRVAINECRRRAKWRGWTRLSPLRRDHPTQDPDPELRLAVERLNVRDRELLALRYGGGLDVCEVAEAMDMTYDQARVALQRAKARLKEELE